MISKTVLFFWAVIPMACVANQNQPGSCFPTFSGSERFRRETAEREEKHDWLDKPRKDHNGVKTDTSPLPFEHPFNRHLEEHINKQINLELFAHYNYLSMAYHFDRDDINMPGFHKFFMKMAEEEHEHARMFMKYQNKRGGRIRLQSIKEPCFNGIWGNGTMAMSRALALEKDINSALLHLHSKGDKDPQFLDFLESNFLGEQVESIKQLSDYVNVLKRLSSPLGEYQFDKLTLLNKE